MNAVDFLDEETAAEADKPSASDFLDARPSASDFLDAKPSASDFLDQPVNDSPKELPLPDWFKKLSPAQQTEYGKAFAPEPVGRTLGRSGRMITGTLADIGTLDKSFPNLEAATSDEPMPVNTLMGAKSTPSSISFPYKVSSGLVESVPKVAAVAGAQAMGVPLPVAAAGVFGQTEEGFSPKDAAIAAALPFVGKYSGQIVGTIASRFGVTATRALEIWKGAGAMTGAAGYLATIDESQIETLPPEERDKARVDMLAGLIGQSVLGPMGVEKEPHNVALDQQAIRNLSIRDKAAQVVGLSDSIKPLAPLTAEALKQTVEPKSTPNETPSERTPNEPTITPIESQPAGIQPEAATGTQEVAQGGEVSPDEVKVGNVQVTEPAKTVRSTTVAWARENLPFGEVATTPDASKSASALSYAGFPVTEVIKIASGEKPYPTKEEFNSHVESAYELDALALESQMRSKLADLGLDARKAKLPNREDFASSESYYNAMQAMESRFRNEGVSMAASMARTSGKKPGTTSEPNVDESGNGDTVKPQELKAIDNPTVEPAAVETATPEQKIQELRQQEFTGMGGAVQSEFELGGGRPSSNKNAIVDLEREQRGLPPMMTPLREAWGDVWTQTMAKIDTDPAWQDRLVSELKEKPRALTPEENLGLLHRRVDLRNELEKSMRDGAQAYDDGRMDAVQEARVRTAEWSDKLSDLENVTKSAGTESGRSLAARKMMMNEDYSLANLVMEKRMANGGRQLTDAENEQVTALSEKLQQTQKALDDHVAQSQERISNLEAERKINELKAEPATVDPVIKRIIDRIGTTLNTQADLARARIKARGAMFSAGVDPTVLADVAIIGADHIFKGATDFAKWSSRMVDEFGDKINPHLAEIFAEANKVFDRQVDATAGKRAPETKKTVRTAGERAADIASKISEKVNAGKKADIAFLVQKLSRAIIERGVTDREALIDEVHGVLKTIMPEMTRREAMDAISGYGEFKQLSKDQISIQLRGMKGEMQQIAKLEDMAAGEPPSKTGTERRTPTEAERKLIKLVNDAKQKFQIPVSDPTTQLKSALDTLKTTLKNRTADLQDRIDRGDYSTRPRREIQLDNEAMRLKADNQRVKDEFQRGLTKDRLKQRSPWEKTMDTMVKWRRAFILSGPVTLAKLTSAAIARSVITPIEEVVGAGLSRIPGIREVSAKAPREGGGFNTHAEVKAITEGLTKGMADAWKTLRTGKSDLTAVYGKDMGIPQSFIDIFGNIHGALKAPVKRAEFARSFEKRATALAKQGVDVTDEFVQMEIGAQSYLDADRAIFMQKNMLNDAYKRLLSRFDQTDKATGKPSVAGKVAGTAARTLLPIVKVPTNIVAETMQYALGTVSGSKNLRDAWKGGIDKLKPEEADLIMRHLKKGSLGAAVMLFGFLSPKSFGGFYQQGEKRDKKDIKPDAARIGDQDIPSSLIHNPLMGAAQLGATIRRVADSKLRKKDKETQGLSHGAMAGALGLADSTPFIREMSEIAKVMNPQQRDQWLGELVKSIAVPQLVKSIADATDKDAEGNTVKRKPHGIGETIETGIPGLRKNVPKDTSRR